MQCKQKRNYMLLPQKSLTVVILIFLLIINSKLFSQDPNFHIYLCFGQSNMEGNATIARDDKSVDNRFQVMEAVDCSNLGRIKGNWYKAIPPLCRCYSGLTPADYFGRKLLENLPYEIRVGIVMVAVAGCKIELFDKNNFQTYAATAPSWMTGIINEYGGNPYARLVEISKLAQKDGVIKGILLHQGESNTGDNAWPSKVKSIYDNLIADLKLKPESVPLLAGELVNADQGGACASMNTIIAKLPQTLPNSYVISSKGCTDTTDNLHFNAAGYRELGRRYGTKMLSILGYAATSSSDKDKIISNYYLSDNYPNPFNPETVISYQILEPGHVTLKVFDLLGKEVAALVNEYQQPGSYKVEFNISNVERKRELTSGIYFCTLQAGSFIQTKKMVLMK